jgi:hypothetical protein
MKQWAEETADSINLCHRIFGLSSLRKAIGLLRGTAAYPDITPEDQSGVLSAFESQLRATRFTATYQKALLALVREYLAALSLTMQARRDLTPEDIAFFDSNPGYYLAPDGRKMPELTGDNSTQLEFIAHARRVRFEYIFLAAERLSRAVEDYVRTANFLESRRSIEDFDKGMTRFEFALPNGLLRITGTGPDTLSDDAVLQIDLGGDDVYHNNAGGCRSLKEGISLCIDHSGNDRYLSDRNYAQGFGYLGVGMLVDMAGTLHRVQASSAPARSGT